MKIKFTTWFCIAIISTSAALHSQSYSGTFKQIKYDPPFTPPAAGTYSGKVIVNDTKDVEWVEIDFHEHNLNMFSIFARINNHYFFGRSLFGPEAKKQLYECIISENISGIPFLLESGIAHLALSRLKLNEEYEISKNRQINNPFYLNNGNIVEINYLKENSQVEIYDFIANYPATKNFVQFEIRRTVGNDSLTVNIYKFKYNPNNLSDKTNVTQEWIIELTKGKGQSFTKAGDEFRVSDRRYNEDDPLNYKVTSLKNLPYSEKDARSLTVVNPGLQITDHRNIGGRNNRNYYFLAGVIVVSIVTASVLLVRNKRKTQTTK